MKLILCPSCADFVAIKDSKRFCRCGQSLGLLSENMLDMTIGGCAIPIAISNDSVYLAYT